MSKVNAKSPNEIYTSPLDNSETAAATACGRLFVRKRKLAVKIQLQLD